MAKGQKQSVICDETMKNLYNKTCEWAFRYMSLGDMKPVCQIWYLSDVEQACLPKVNPGLKTLTNRDNIVALG